MPPPIINKPKAPPASTGKNKPSQKAAPSKAATSKATAKALPPKSAPPKATESLKASFAKASAKPRTRFSSLTSEFGHRSAQPRTPVAVISDKVPAINPARYEESHSSHDAVGSGSRSDRHPMLQEHFDPDDQDGVPYWARNV